jgi:hypothetical protein
MACAVGVLAKIVIVKYALSVTAAPNGFVAIH